MGVGAALSRPQPPGAFWRGPSLWFLPGALPGSKAPLFPLQACERDVQCGPGTCCAVSLWLRGLRMCTPLGREGDDCHPGSHKVLQGPARGTQLARQSGDWNRSFLTPALAISH